LFITTANVWGAIPRPLRDRAELIEISGYTELEKLHIALKHLLPKQLAAHGLGSEQLIVSENAVAKVIEGYTREAGVRNLERELAGICRKAARQIVEGQAPPVRVTMANLERLLGPIKYRRTRLDAEDRVGVATGLVYTAVGGDTLTIEASIVKGKGRVQLTGKLGEVMRESAQAAFSYIRAHADRWDLPQSFPEQIDVHVHVPEGAVPKEGPSAGITMATALVSALTVRPVRKDVAMTGEVTLHGRVLPIGGLKEKLIAADRAGIACVIIPKENAIDLDELPAEVRRRLEIRLVESVDEVLEIALQPAAVDGEEAVALAPPFVAEPESPTGWEESFEGTP
ncbi:MAG TPA: S16 family serine protease, partial [Limnochordia bacterium]|nr:S16 family serine protease [Limnochordia bacterium]